MTRADERRRRQEAVSLHYAIRAAKRITADAAAHPPQRVAPVEQVRPMSAALSVHAAQRCTQMQIDPALVLAMVENPQLTYRQRLDRWITLHPTADVAAIYTEADQLRTVVTVLYRREFSRTAP